MAWLNQLPPDIAQSPPDFLQQTGAPTSMARLIRRQRTYWPLDEQMNSISLDSRLLPDLGEPWANGRFFSGRVDIYRGNQNLNLLTIEGRPYPQSPVHRDFIYSIHVPLTAALLYDAARPIQARYEILEGSSTGGVETYNEASSGEYDETDPAIFFRSFKHAVADLHLMTLYRHQGRDSLVFFKKSKSPLRHATALGRIASLIRSVT